MIAKSSMIITTHARERYYQRVIAGKCNKDKIDKLVKQSFENATFLGKAEDGLFIWDIKKPYPCIFITRPEQGDHVLVTVLWGDITITNKIYHHKEIAFDLEKVREQLKKEEKITDEYENFITEKVNKKEKILATELELVKLLRKNIAIKQNTLQIETKIIEKLIEQLNFSKVNAHLKRSLRIVINALENGINPEECILCIKECLSEIGEDGYLLNE